MKWKNELFFVRYSVGIHCFSWKLWANFNLISSYTEHGIIIFIILLFLLSWILLYKPPTKNKYRNWICTTEFFVWNKVRRWSLIASTSKWRSEINLILFLLFLTGDIIAIRVRLDINIRICVVFIIWRYCLQSLSLLKVEEMAHLFIIPMGLGNGWSK